MGEYFAGRKNLMSPRTCLKVTRPSKYGKRFLPLLYADKLLHRICFLSTDNDRTVVVIILVDGTSYLVRDGNTRWWSNLNSAMVRRPPPNWEINQSHPWRDIIVGFRKNQYSHDYGGLMRKAWGSYEAFTRFLVNRGQSLAIQSDMGRLD